MIANSDDESEELNRIREKLQRQSTSHQDAQCRNRTVGNIGSSDDSSALDIDSDDETEHRPPIKSKHWNDDHSSSNFKNITNANTSKLETLAQVCEASSLWNDDDDDGFDAKLASMNVLPFIAKISTGDNPYRNPNQRWDGTSLDNNLSPQTSAHCNNKLQLSTNFAVVHRPVPDEQFNDNDDVIASLNYSEYPIDSSSSAVTERGLGGGDISHEPKIGTSNNNIVQHGIIGAIDDRTSNEIRSSQVRQYDNASKVNIIPRIDHRINPYAGRVEISSIRATKPSLLSSSGSEPSETLHSNNERSSKPILETSSCQYEEASEHVNWFEDMASIDSTKFFQSDVLTVDAFGFDIDPVASRDFGEGKQLSENVKSAHSVQNFNNDRSNELVGFVDRVHDTHDEDVTVEKPVDESFCSRDGSEDRISEVDPSLYAPQAVDAMREPIVHYFTPRNRPLHCRKKILVEQVFSPPISLLWMNKFDVFNDVQSEIANMLAYSDDNVVISAPTGAGKTAVFEMTMARFFAADIQAAPPGLTETPTISKHRKIVYIAPSKALCEERFSDWSKRLSAMNLGIEMAVVTGDGDPSDALHDVAVSHFILSTPEKWDSLTRRWTEKFFLFASVKLFLVDEVHLIADESRGCCLEAIVCRMKTIQRAASQVSVTEEEIAVSSYTNTSPNAISSLMRFVAVSATLPNITDIAKFFEANEAHTFDESYRPVPLTTHVIGQGKLTTDGKNGQFMFWKNLDRNVPELIIKHSNRRPTIVFCHSKADCEKLADLLATTHNIGRRDDTTSGIACRTRLSKLQRVLIHAVAYHHAGLELDDRRLVEESFSRGLIRVLCATSTLAMGVNLPAHLVIVKGTSAYRGTGEGGGYQDIDQASLLQMIGRAGRPGYDTAGTAVIMTDNDSKSRIEKLASSGLPPAKSQLIGSKLIETMNTEVSQRVITCIESATDWIKGTLYYIQLLQEPEAHGVRVVSNFSIDTYILKICRAAVDRLKDIGVLATSISENIYPLVASHIMSHRLVTYPAMKDISQISYDASQSQILRKVSMLDGMHCPVRRNEKKALNSIHKELKLYKLEGPLSKVRIQEPWQKAFVLLQVYIEELDFEGFDYVMRQEVKSMVEYATRILSAIEELCLKGTMNGNVLTQCLKIRRSIAVHLWSAKDGVLRQIKGIGKAITFSLLMNGISTFEDVMNHSEIQLEKAANRPHPFGSDLRKATASILQSRLLMSANIERELVTNTPIVLTCVLKANSENIRQIDPIEKATSISYTLIVYTDKEAGMIFGKQNIVGPETFRFGLPPSFAQLHVQLIASIVGLDETVVLDNTEKSIQQVCTNRIPTIEMKSKKRIREASTQISGVLGSRSAAVDKLVKITRDQRYKVAATQVSKIHTLASTAGQTSVTPSPHLTSTPAYRQPVASAATKHVSPYVPSHLANPGFEYNISPVIRSFPTSYPEAQDQQCTHTPTFQGRSYMPGCGIGCRQTSNHISDASQSQYIPSILNQPDSWKRLKSQQQKSQQRAFVRHSDNPFKNYKHDPNDTELYLDQLASCSKATSPTSFSIIPPKGYLAIDATRRQQHVLSTSSNIESYRTNPRGMFVRRKQLQGNTVSMQELLSQKAAESNFHIMAPSHYASYVHSPSYRTLRNQYPIHYENSSVAPSYIGPSQKNSKDNLWDYDDLEHTPYDQNLQHHLTDSNLYDDRNIEIHHDVMYTNQPASIGYVYGLHEKGKAHSQFDLRQVSGQASHRDASVRYCTTNENMEDDFFF